VAAVRRAKAGFDGLTPEYVFTCAGKRLLDLTMSVHLCLIGLTYKRHTRSGLSYPRYFVTQELSEFDVGMQVNYMGTVYTAHVSRSMV
jgi:hypothetical protein